MENKFGYLSDRGDHGGHLAEKFLFLPQVIAFTVSRFACRYYATASNKRDYLKTRFFDLQMLIT